jgi:hypothetical protein
MMNKDRYAARRVCHVVLVIAVAGCTLATRSLGQDLADTPAPQPAPLYFEAASIKLTPPENITDGQWSRPGGSEF